MRNFRQAWTKWSLASISKISKVSSEAWRKSSLAFFYFKIPHNAGLEKFLKNSFQCWNIFIDTTSNIFSIVGGGVKWKIPHNVRFLPGGIEKFLKNSSQCWIHPAKNPTLWGIFVKLELNHHLHQCQRSQRCHHKLEENYH